MESTAFNHASLQPVHSIGYHRATLHGIHCIQSCFIATTAFNREPLGHAAWNPLHSNTLHVIHCIQTRCMESTAFNRDALGHAGFYAAWPKASRLNAVDYMQHDCSSVIHY